MLEAKFSKIIHFSSWMKWKYIGEKGTVNARHVLYCHDIAYYGALSLRDLNSFFCVFIEWLVHISNIIKTYTICLLFDTIKSIILRIRNGPDLVYRGNFNLNFQSVEVIRRANRVVNPLARKSCFEAHGNANMKDYLFVSFACRPSNCNLVVNSMHAKCYVSSLQKGDNYYKSGCFSLQCAK